MDLKKVLEYRRNVHLFQTEKVRAIKNQKFEEAAELRDKEKKFLKLLEKESTIYLALYNPMIEESSFETLSVHFTKEGAEEAIKIHKEDEKKKFNKCYSERKAAFEFGTFQEWGIHETIIEE